MIGIKGYGVYIPSLRIKVGDIVDTWGNSNAMYLQHVLKLQERALCDFDEDVITMAVEASKNAIDSAQISTDEIGSLLLGSHTSPYSTKPASSVILDALGLSSDTNIGDVQFSSKSGTLAIQLCAALSQQTGKNSLAIGTDNISIHTEPGDSYEYPASVGAAAFIIGTENVIAEIEGFSTHNSDTPDNYRLEGDRYITSGGDAMVNTEVGQPEHTITAANRLMAQLEYKSKDFDFVVFHQAYGVTPLKLGSALGFENEQIIPGCFSEYIGDTGSASALIGLAGILDKAEQGQKILVLSYGSGAGSDAIAFKVTKNITKTRGNAPTVQQLLDAKQYVNYSMYAKLEKKYHRKDG